MNTLSFCTVAEARAATPLATLQAVALIVGLGLSGGSVCAGGNQPAFCSQTADAALKACRAEVTDDYWIATANCINITNRTKRRACSNNAHEELEDGKAQCKSQWQARLKVCDLVGEKRFDPAFGPGKFVNPAKIGRTVEPNPYFPLVRGTRWVYKGGDETITVTVTDKTKLIRGVTCRVVHDVVREDGKVIEDTEDWYAQDKDGNVWYFGEVSQEFETFEGDNPEEPELVSIDGSWKAGREGAKPGILVLARPRVGGGYREEVSLGEAEDVAEIISITGNESVPAASCHNKCLVTRNFTALEPGANERKYYAPGVGLILEVAGRNRVELVKFSKP